MLNFLPFLPSLPKFGSIGAKIATLGITLDGLQKLWLSPKRPSHALSTKLMFSTVYTLHLCSTALSLAQLFDEDLISPSLTNSLVGITSFLNTYANFMDAYLSRSLLRRRYQVIHQELDKLALDEEFCNALISDVNECKEECQFLTQQIEELTGFVIEIENINRHNLKAKDEQLTTLYLKLTKKYEESQTQVDIIEDNFFQIERASLNQLGLNKMQYEINDTIDKIKKIELKIDSSGFLSYSRRTQIRQLTKLKDNQEKLKQQQIIYKQTLSINKIYSLDLNLRRQLMRLQDSPTILGKQPHPASLNVIMLYLEDRIKYLRHVIQQQLHPSTAKRIPYLQLGITQTLQDKLEDDFYPWLHDNIIQQIEHLKNTLDNQANSAKKIKACFSLFANEFSMDDIQRYFIARNTMSQIMIELERNLLLEGFNQQTRKLGAQFSMVSLFISLLLNFASQTDSTKLLKPLSLMTSTTSGLMSAWNFYQKNLLSTNIDIEKNHRIQQMIKETEEKINGQLRPNLEKSASIDLEPFFSPSTSKILLLTNVLDNHSIIIKDESINIKSVRRTRRIKELDKEKLHLAVLGPRHAKQQAKLLIHHFSHQSNLKSQKSAHHKRKL